jgi:pyruvate dehydrogenase E1 component
VPDDKLSPAPFYHPGKHSPEVKYMLERRRELGGLVPERRAFADVPVELPGTDLYAEFLHGTDTVEVSTTMAFARLLAKLLRDPKLGRRVVPIVPDEARTFGMDALFSQVGIYSSQGQLYEPVDKGKLLYYRETKDGQVIEEGITEAGSMASFTAAGTSYSTHGVPTVPFYIFYSMFGFQRTGDLMWAAADMRTQGFLLGATAGRTTLAGEGLQHCDGHSHLLASTVPHVRGYDPAYAYELAVIIRDGLRRMLEERENVYYYLTLQNESYPMPAMPAGVEAGIVRGLYRLREAPERLTHHVVLFGSGSILNEVLRAQRILAERFSVSSDVWSVTSYQMLRRDALACEREGRLHPESEPRVPYLRQALGEATGPFVAATDYLKLLPEMVARWLPGRLVPLGTDGFGMSDTREALRRHFEVDAESIALAALDALRIEGRLPAAAVSSALGELGIDPEKIDPLEV